MTDTQQSIVSRRGVLAKLGLAAVAVYSAPVLLQLGEARASGFSGGSYSGRGRGRRRRRSYS